MPAPEPAPNNADTTLGSGIESGIVLVLFVLAGYGLDRWLGTSPVFTLVLFGLGAVGLFYRFKAAYTIRMDAYERQRAERQRAERAPLADRPTSIDEGAQ